MKRKRETAGIARNERRQKTRTGGARVPDPRHDGPASQRAHGERRHLSSLLHTVDPVARALTAQKMAKKRGGGAAAGSASRRTGPPPQPNPFESFGVRKKKHDVLGKRDKGLAGRALTAARSEAVERVSVGGGVGGAWGAMRLFFSLLAPLPT